MREVAIKRHAEQICLASSKGKRECQCAGSEARASEWHTRRRRPKWTGATLTLRDFVGRVAVGERRGRSRRPLRDRSRVGAV